MLATATDPKQAEVEAAMASFRDMMDLAPRLYELVEVIGPDLGTFTAPWHVRSEAFMGLLDQLGGAGSADRWLELFAAAQKAFHELELLALAFVERLKAAGVSRKAERSYWKDATASDGAAWEGILTSAGKDSEPAPPLAEVDVKALVAAPSAPPRALAHISTSEASS